VTHLPRVKRKVPVPCTGKNVRRAVLLGITRGGQKTINCFQELHLPMVMVRFKHDKKQLNYVSIQRILCADRMAVGGCCCCLCVLSFVSFLLLSSFFFLRLSQAKWYPPSHPPWK
jgi:hypothetical protein